MGAYGEEASCAITITIRSSPRTLCAWRISLKHPSTTYTPASMRSHLVTSLAVIAALLAMASARPVTGETS